MRSSGPKTGTQGHAWRRALLAAACASAFLILLAAFGLHLGNRSPERQGAAGDLREGEPPPASEAAEPEEPAAATAGQTPPVEPTGRRSGGIALRGRIVTSHAGRISRDRTIPGALVRVERAPPWPWPEADSHTGPLDPRPRTPGDATRQGALVALSGPDGRFELSGVLPGEELLIEAEQAEAGYFALRYTLAAAGAGEVSSPIDAGDVALDPGCEVRILLESTGGNPIPGASVWLTHRSAFPAGLEMARARGHARQLAETAPGDYRIARIPRVPHLLRIDAPGFVPLSQRVEVGKEPTARIVLEATRRLEGRVVDAEGAPIAGATVDYDGGLLPDQTLRTGQDGTFRFARFPEQARLRARAPGFLPAEVDSGAPGEENATVEIRLEGDLGLAGIVIDAETEQLLGGATLRYLSSLTSEGQVVATTGPDGRFRVSGVGRGLCWLVAEHPTHAPLRVGPLEVGGDGAWEDVRFALARGRDLEGLVRGGADGAPVEGATVRVTQPGTESRPGIVHTATTDGGGRFALHGLLAADAKVIAVARGFAPGRRDLDLADLAASPCILELEVEGVVRTRVVDSSGKPISGARVTLGGARPGVFFLVEGAAETYALFEVTNDRGEVRFGGLLQGMELRLRAEADGHLTNGNQWTPASPRDASEVIELRLERAAQARLIVLDPAGMPISGVQVSCRQGGDASGDLWALRGATLDDGSARIGPIVPPGLWVRASAPGWPDTPAAFIEASEEEPPPGEGGLLEATLRFPPGERLEGRVTCGAAALPNVHLQLGSYLVAESFTDPDGSFIFEGIQPGEWLLIAGKAGYATLRAQVRVPGPPVELALEELALLQGTVEYEEGAAPIRGDFPAYLLAIPPGRGSEAVARVSPAGEFSLRAPAGTYEVRLQPPGASEVREVLSLAAGERRQKSFRLLPSTLLRVRVEDLETHAPVQGCRVELERRGDEVPLSVDPANETDGNGLLELRNLAPAVYDLLLVGGGTHCGSLEGIEVRPGTPGDATLRARRSRGVRGVVSWRGHAAPGAAVEVSRVDEPASVRVVADGLGRFEAANLLPGAYSVIAAVSSKGSRAARAFVPDHDGAFCEVEIDVASVRLECTLRAGNSPAAADSAVRIYAQDGTLQDVFAGDSGAFEVVLPGSGVYDVVVVENGEAIHRERIDVPGDVSELRHDIVWVPRR